MPRGTARDNTITGNATGRRDTKHQISQHTQSILDTRNHVVYDVHELQAQTVALVDSHGGGHTCLPSGPVHRDLL